MTDTQELVEQFTKSDKGSITKIAQYAQAKGPDAMRDFLWEMFQQITGDAAKSSRRILGGYLTHALERWAKPRLYDKYRDSHFTNL